MIKTKYVSWNMHANEDGFIWSQLRGKYLDFYLLLSYTITPHSVYAISILKCKTLHISAKLQQNAKHF